MELWFLNWCMQGECLLTGFFSIAYDDFSTMDIAWLCMQAKLYARDIFTGTLDRILHCLVFHDGAKSSNANPFVTSL